ncbi:MAG: 4Fe-4S dicluster domain-containing protein, partial [Candidatus Nanopelagicaceae bacterium]
MDLILGLLSYGITVVAVGLFAVRSLEMYRRIKAGQPDPTRSNEKGKRFALMTKEVLGHTKMLNFTGSGIAHWFVMIGFVALFGTLVTAYGQVLDPSFLLPVIGKWDPYVYFVMGIAWLTGVSIVTLIGIRQVTRIVRKGRSSRFFGSYSGRAYFVEAVILVIVVCVIWLHQLEVALIDGEDVGGLIQVVATLKIVVSMSWFIVVASNLRMGVAWHRFLAPFNIFFKRNVDAAPTLGALPEMLSKGALIDFEDPKEDDVFGIGKAADISWKGLLDMASCTECGRCQSQCPAWHTEKPLSPKLLIMAMRDHALAKVPSDTPIVGETISPDVLWSCTTCGACVNECPVDIEHIDHIVNMRRFQVLVESEFPTELGGTFRNL